MWNINNGNTILLKRSEKKSTNLTANSFLFYPCVSWGPYENYMIWCALFSCFFSFPSSNFFENQFFSIVFEQIIHRNGGRARNKNIESIAAIVSKKFPPFNCFNRSLKQYLIQKRHQKCTFQAVGPHFPAFFLVLISCRNWRRGQMNYRSTPRQGIPYRVFICQFHLKCSDF